MVNDEPPKKNVENLFSTMYYIEKKKIMFHIFSSLTGGAHFFQLRSWRNRARADPPEPDRDLSWAHAWP